MKPLLSWPGGKSRLSRRLAGFLPAHQVYVEPFAGGASVFFEKKPAEIEVLGDKSKWAMGFYKAVRKGELRSCPRKIKADRKTFKKYRMCASACCRLFTNKLSYHGNMKEMGALGRGTYKGQVLSRVPDYERRLRKTRIRIGDFAATMRKYDSKNTVHFLDPPWPVGYTSRHYAHKIPLLESVRKVSDTMKGKVMVIYNDSPQVARAFARRGWRRYRIHTTQGAGSKGAVKTTFLIATRGFRIRKSAR